MHRYVSPMERISPKMVPQVTQRETCLRDGSTERMLLFRSTLLLGHGCGVCHDGHERTDRCCVAAKRRDKLS